MQCEKLAEGEGASSKEGPRTVGIRTSASALGARLGNLACEKLSEGEGASSKEGPRTVGIRTSASALGARHASGWVRQEIFAGAVG